MYDCPECVPLWAEYARATVEHIRLEHAVLASLSNPERLANLKAVAERAGHRRAAAREAIVNHENIVRSNSCGSESQGRDRSLRWQHLADDVMRASVRFHRAQKAYEAAGLSLDFEKRDGRLAEFNKSLTQYCVALDRLCDFTLRGRFRPTNAAS